MMIALRDPDTTRLHDILFYCCSRPVWAGSHAYFSSGQEEVNSQYPEEQHLQSSFMRIDDDEGCRRANSIQNFEVFFTSQFFTNFQMFSRCEMLCRLRKQQLFIFSDRNRQVAIGSNTLIDSYRFPSAVSEKKVKFLT